MFNLIRDLVSGRKRLFMNMASQYGLQIAKYIIPFISLPYLARVLGPDAYSVRAYVLSVMTFAQIFVDGGFNLSATKLVVESKQDAKRIDSIVGDALLAKVLLASITGTVVMLASLFVPLMADNRAYVFIAFVGVCLNSFCPDFVFMGYEEMRILTTRYVASKLAGLVLMFFTVHSSADLLWVPVMDVLSGLIAFLWSYAGMSRRFGVRPSLGKLRGAFNALGDSGLYFLSNASAAIHNSYTTLIIGVAANDQVEVAYWSLVVTAISAVQHLYSPISTSLYPHMISKADYTFLKKMILLSLPVVSLGCVALYVLSDPIILLLGGNEYVEAGNVFRLAIPVLWFSFYGIMLGWPVLGACGKVKEMTISTVAGGATAFVSMTVLALSGYFSLTVVAVLRVFSEIVVSALRAYYSLGFMKKELDKCSS